MSLFRRAQRETSLTDVGVPARPAMSRTGLVSVTNDTALRHSAVWACLRLRADLVSTMPVDVFQSLNGIRHETYKPPILVHPGGERVDMHEWMYSSQVDLDRAGNDIGVITEKDGFSRPRRIDLQALADVVVRREKGELRYYIGGQRVPTENIWHEKQYTLPGLDVGLSPVAYAAWSIGEYQSIQQFALDWFGDGTIPAAHLRNTAKTVSPTEAAAVKDRFKGSVANRDLFVTGNDWEYKMIQAEQASADWIEAKKFSIGDIARFFGCPGDLIDAAVSTGSITYANVTQRNLQFLIYHLGPAIIRREAKLSTLVSEPRYVKLNTDALLRMDPETRAKTIQVELESRTLAPSEARQLLDRPPLTAAQIAEFETLYGPPRQAPKTGQPTGVNA